MTDEEVGYLTDEEVGYLYPDIEPRKRGRPAAGTAAEPQCRRNVTVSDRLIEKAKAIGDGNISEGIRIALEAHRDQ